MSCVVSSKSSSLVLAGWPPAPVFTGSAVRTAAVVADREEEIPDVGAKAVADERRAANTVIDSFIVVIV